MTPQEFFDRAVTGVIGQGKPALARPNSIACAYRAPDGCRCAAGHNIPDDEYHPDFEDTVASALQVDGLIPSWQGLDPAFIRAAQSDHDQAARTVFNFLPDYIRRSRFTAQHFGLSTEALDAAVAKAGL